MSTSEKINIRKGIKLFVETFEVSDKEVSVAFSLDTDKKCLLHWGVSMDQKGWQIPPKECWPEGTVKYQGADALQTPFSRVNGENKVTIKLDPSLNVSSINFALYFPDEKRWDNNKGSNYQIALPKPVAAKKEEPGRVEQPAVPPPPVKPALPVGPPPFEELQKVKGDGEVIYEAVDDVGADGQIASAVVKKDGQYRIVLISNIPGSLILHWGVGIHRQGDWSLPPQALWPDNTTIYENASAKTPFRFDNGLNRLTMIWPQEQAPLNFSFVLFQPDSARWLKRHSGNFHVPVNLPVIKDQAVFDSSTRVVTGF